MNLKEGDRPGRARRRLLQAVGALLLAAVCGLLLFVWAWSEAVRDPIVRRASVAVPGWPAGEPARTILFLSDTHVAGPDTPPARLAGVVDRLNALKPDLVLLGGDYSPSKNPAVPGYHRYSPTEAIAPLARLRAPLGVIAVMGNHDYDVRREDYARVIAASGITLLRNEAVRRGPFIIGGVDDKAGNHRDIPGTERAMAALGSGVRLVLSHSPDIIPELRQPTAANFAGHTHCGQISLPIYGPLNTMSGYGRRFACGRIEDNGRTIFVTAGVGTSGVPLRILEPPDVWLVRFGPPANGTR